jgi:hypothetical protein
MAISVIAAKAAIQSTEFPGFRLALAIASLSGMTLELSRNLKHHH